MPGHPTQTNGKPTDKKEPQKELKKQESMEEVLDEQIPPPPRTAILLLEAYPEKMIQIHEELEAKEMEAIRAEEEARRSEEEKRKGDNMAKSQVGHNKSTLGDKSHAGQGHPEEDKKKRKESFDVKHLENDPPHICYTQNRNVLLVDTSQGIDQITEMLDSQEPNIHISFWVYFQSIKYDHPSKLPLIRK